MSTYYAKSLEDVISSLTPPVNPVKDQVWWKTSDNTIYIWNGSSWVVNTPAVTSDPTKAPINSPALTGIPTTPTANPGTNTLQIASTAFVKTAVDQGIGAPNWYSITGKPSTFPPTLPIPSSGVTGLDTAQAAQDTAIAGKAPTVHTHTTAQITGLDTTLATKAPLIDPVFTGNPQAPTPNTGDNDTSIATTAFVTAAVSAAPGSYVQFEYMFDTGIVEPVSSANIRFNNATPSAVTKIWVHDISSLGKDNSHIFPLAAIGTKFYIQDKDDASKYQTFTISGTVIDKGTYSEFPVTFLNGGTVLSAQRAFFVITGNSSGGGIGVTDGDKGDIVISSSGTSWMLDSAVVTATAKTVLDDTTTAAMLTTLGAVAKAGDTITGNLAISRTAGATVVTISSGDQNTALYLDKGPVDGRSNFFDGKRNGVVRWRMVMGDSTAEGGSNTGSDFLFQAFDDSTNTRLFDCIKATRSTGVVTITKLISTTQTAGTNTTDVATTAFVTTANALNEKLANKGAVSGYAPLDASQKVPAINLPSYVDDVLEYANLAAFPGTGATGIIYIALDTNKTYRWGGSSYTEISPSPGSSDAVPEGSVNLYYTAARSALKLDVSAYTAADVLTKIKTVDGASSGLDADLLDNNDGAYYLSLTNVTGTLPAARFDDTAHGTRAGGTLHANVIAAGAAGFMTGADKTKLDGIAASANNYVHPSGDGNLHVPATGTSSNGMVLKAAATAGSGAWATLAKTDVGLGNVDNTADVNKPVSTAQQTALDGRVLDTGDTMTGSLTVSYANAIVNIDKAASGQEQMLRFRTGTSNRWSMSSFTALESGANAGSPFYITRYDDAGASLGVALSIQRTNGLVTVPGGLSSGGYLQSTGTTADLYLDKAAGNYGSIHFRSGGGVRWQVVSDNTAEGGSNAGSDFAIRRYSDAPALIDTALTINRATATMTLTGNLIVAKATPVVEIQKAASGQESALLFRTGSAVAGLRWKIVSDNSAESAGTGSHFRISRHDDTGTQLDYPFVINRLNGAITLNTATMATTTLGASGQLSGNAATAIPAGGAATAGLRLSNTADFGTFFGSGVPTLSAAKGSQYLRSDGASGSYTYVNTNGATAWSALADTAYVIAGDALTVLKAGDTMTGDLTISKATPSLSINKAASGQEASIDFKTGTNLRWRILTNTSAEVTNGGSNFQINRYNDAGVLVDTPFGLDRSAGAATFTGAIIVSRANASIYLDKPASGTINAITMRTALSNRWQIEADITAESANAGSNFNIKRYNDASTLLDAPISIERLTGVTSFKTTATDGASIRLPHGTAPTSPVNGDVWTTTAGMFVRVNGVTVGPLKVTGAEDPIIVTAAMSPYSWTPPAGMISADFYLYGTGGSGGGGAMQVVGAACSGGGSGAGGGKVAAINIKASDIGTGVATVLVGTGPAGGAGAVATGAGSNGTSTGLTRVTFASGQVLNVGNGGGGGGGTLAAISYGGGSGTVFGSGTNATTSAAGIAGGSNLAGGGGGAGAVGGSGLALGTGGGGSGAVAAGAVGIVGGSAAYASSAGGSGGGITTANAVFAGGPGGFSEVPLAGGTAGLINGGAGGNGVNVGGGTGTCRGSNNYGATGGGGGGSNIGVGGKGGDGGTPGGGGGGGGSGQGAAGGAGGKGGDGMVIIVVH